MVVEEVGYDEIECEGCVGRLFLFCSSIFGKPGKGKDEPANFEGR